MPAPIMARSYYEAFEVYQTGAAESGRDEASSEFSRGSGVSFRDEQSRRDLENERWSDNSEGHSRGYGWRHSGGRNENWTWGPSSGGSWSGRSSGRWVWVDEAPRDRGAGRYENWRWTDEGSSEASSWGSGLSHGRGHGVGGIPGDPGELSGGLGPRVHEGHPGASCHGKVDVEGVDPCSPMSPAGHGFDRHGNLPSGELSAVGDASGPKDVGGEMAGERKYKGKPSSSYPPIFRAKKGESYHDWKRSVSFWLGGEGGQIPVELIGPRIMVQLRDRASQLVKHLNNEDVNCPGGMARIFQVLEKSPLVRQLDKHRIDQHRKKLMNLTRYPHESLESYVTRGSIYRSQLVSLDNSLEMGEKFYVGHLLDHARLSRKDRVFIRTRAGVESEENVTNAMIELSAELEGESGCPIGQSEPNLAGVNGDEHLVQRESSFNHRKNNYRGALAAENLDAVSEGGMEDTLSLCGEPGEESFDEDAPPELVEAEKEAFALQFRAKQRMAEVKKMRNFYKKQDPEQRRRQLAEKMKNTHCHNCGELGHWSRECPKSKAQNGQQTLVAGHWKKSRTKTRGDDGLQSQRDAKPCLSVSEEAEWDLLASLCSVSNPKLGAGESYMALTAGLQTWDRADRVFGADHHGVLWCMDELASAVILDLGCMRSVCGVKWANQLIRKWKDEKRWLRVESEEETFRFGNGQTLKSRFNIQFVATFAQKPVVLMFSVVDGECPPLLSRPACTQLGAVFDCTSHTLSSRRLKVKAYGMRQSQGGHYLMNIEEFHVMQHVIEIPEDYKMPESCEAVIWDEGCQQDVCVAGFSADSSDSDSDAQVDGTHRAPSLPGMRRLWSSDSRVSGSDQRRCNGGGRDGCMEPDERDLHRPESGRTKSSRGSEGHSGDGSLRGTQRGDTACSNSKGQGKECSKELGSGCDEQLSGMGSGITGGDHPILRHGERRVPAHPAGARDAEEKEREESGASSQIPGQAWREGSTHGGTSKLSQSLALLEPRGGSESGSQCEGEDVHVFVEEDAVAVEGEEGGGKNLSRSDLEEESPLAGYPHGQRSGSPLGTYGGHAEADVDSQSLGADVTDEEMETVKEKIGRPRRGLTQQMKKAVLCALAVLALVQGVGKWETKYTVLEVFAGKATITSVALTREGWKAYEPVDILLGGTSHDLANKKNREALLEAVRRWEPDLVVMTPPCGPWSLWQNQAADMEALAEKRRLQLPFWKLVADIWEEQTKQGRLAMTEQPETSEALNLSYMLNRKEVHRVIVDQCQFGLKDPVSHLFYRKATALDVNNKMWADQLAQVKRCNHAPSQHEQVKGTVKYEGQWHKRSELAGRWPAALASHVLSTAEKVLSGTLSPQPERIKLHEPCGGDQWFVHAVEEVVTPEEALRNQLKEIGGERYDFVTFEGQARALPRRIRSMLAHLHVTMGHLSNERLARMLSLAGGSRQILLGVHNMRCQVCAMVKPPSSKPQVSYNKPSNFNQRISGDCFHVWDIKNLRYTICHFIDELTDYQVGDITFDPISEWTARVLRDKWYGVFGTPDVLVTDGGKEFCGALARLNDMCGVQHEVVPDQAKWRMGHAERHGALVKIIMMKIITALRIETMEEMKWTLTYALAAKNRMCNAGGMSPLQAVTGRNSPLPASLMAQLYSGKMKFRLNQELTRDEALRRAERIRAAAVEACHWVDAHEGLRKALNARSRPPKFEGLKEGTCVYVYEPPTSRKGLARRMQDDVSWNGPGVIVCVEKDQNIPHRVWVRIRSKVKAYPLEKIRLATADEMVSAEFIVGALREVEGELEEGRLKVVEQERVKDTRREQRMKQLKDGRKSPAAAPTTPAQAKALASPSTPAAAAPKTPAQTKALVSPSTPAAAAPKTPVQTKVQPPVMKQVPTAHGGRTEEPPPSPDELEMTLMELARHRSAVEEPRPKAKKQTPSAAIAPGRKTEEPRPGRGAPHTAQAQASASAAAPSQPHEVAVPPSLTSSEDDEAARQRWEARREMQHDVPQALRRDKKGALEEEEEVEPHLLPFVKKQKLFQDMQGKKGEASTMAQAELRSELEDMWRKLKVTRKRMRWAEKEIGRRKASKAKHSIFHVAWDIDTFQQKESRLKEMQQLLQEAEVFGAQWRNGNGAWEEEILRQKKERIEAEQQMSVEISQVITGKQRLEYQWNKLDAAWQAAYQQPLLKAVRVYFEHEALEGVKEDAMIDPRKILNSRFVLTNKGEENLEGAELKARWILGGHKDPELGNHPTLAPTSSLLGHNLLNFVAVQMGWTVYYEDVSAAFLQGKPLPREREVYVRLPGGYPEYVKDEIRKLLGAGFRVDLLRLLKGGFGLAESPRLWYLEYKATLKELGLWELKLVPGMFRAFHPNGELRAVVCIHVDDTRYAGDSTAQELWDELHKRLKFGALRKATDGWQKFCGRWERQDPQTFEFYYSMNEYVKKIPEISKGTIEFNGKVLTESIKKEIGSLLGQISWAGRQGRPDLMYGVSHCQQLAGLGDPEAIVWLKRLLQRARQSMEIKISQLGCGLDEVIVVSASDAAFAAQPRQGSQGGVTCLIGHPKILQQKAPTVILETQSVRINRVVRCSMSAELSMAATAFEHGDFTRAVMAELLDHQFSLQDWKWFSSKWKHYLVIDAKTGYDVLNNEGVTADRKIMIDAAVLREAMTELSCENYVRWMPGKEMISDGLTKWNGNGVLEKVMKTGEWSLVDTPEAQELREAAAMRKRVYEAKKKQSPEQ